jgi:hypothetical protein
MTTMKRDPKTSFRDQLDAEAKTLREKAKMLPSGMERDVLLRKARQFEVAANVTKWIDSPGLQPPTTT